MPTGAELIAAERHRQIENEGWTASHDDEHGPGILAEAGACYAADVAANLGLSIARTYISLPSAWPWDDEWWKPTPKDPIRQLVKAGALIAAEIDRLQRAGGR